MTLVGNFKEETIRVIRYGNGAYGKKSGRWEGGKQFADETFTVSVQPLRGNELLNLPQGQRESENVKIYSDERIFTVRNSNAESKTADCIEWRGCSYQIQSVEDWTKTDIPHYKSIAVKIEKQPSERKVG